jgi:ABC-type transporter MlaC component
MGNISAKNEDLENIFGSSSADEIEAVLKNNPQFRDMNFIELKDNKEFQKALKEYKIKSQSSPTDAKKLKSIKKMSSVLTSNTALITDKDLKHALTPYKNPHAYIQQLDEAFFQQLEFDPENGTMNIEGNVLETITLQNIITRSNIKELDLPLLRSLYTVIYCYADKIDTNTVQIYLPTLAKHLGVNVRGDRPQELFSKIKAFENVIGVLDNGSFYRMLTFLGYTKQTNSITFGSPYMNRILRALQEANTITPKTGKQYISPHYSFLIHGSIANERNKPAVEIVNTIVTLLHQRGVEKPLKTNLSAAELKKTVKQAIQEEFNIIKDNITFDEDLNLTTMHKKISTIIEEIPILTEALDKETIDTKTNLPKPKITQDKNNILKRAFSGAYTLLKTKTDVYKYFKNLQITEIIPTISTIDQVIEISHVGINEDYKKA